MGNFFSLMPRDLMERSHLTGIELDEISAQIAQLLHPDASIHRKGYEESKTPDGFYDLAITNVPFENTKPADRRYDRFRASLHNYFFLKAMDQVKPGGLVWCSCVGKRRRDVHQQRGIRVDLYRRAWLSMYS